MKWFLIGSLGALSIIFMMWLILCKKQTFDSSLLGLLTLGIILIMISIIQPDRIKYGDAELILRKAEKASEKAEKTQKLVNETLAMLLWNYGRWDVGADTKEASRLIYDLYGEEKGKQVIKYFVQEGIFRTSKDEKHEILKEEKNLELPSGVNSEIINIFDKEKFQNKKE